MNNKFQHANGKTLPPSSSVTRREAMKVAGSGMLGLALAGGMSQSLLAQEKTVTAIMPGVFIPKEARPIIERLSGVKVENAPYVSPTDTLAKLMAPGGSARYDLMISVTDFVKGPALGRSPGDEKIAPLDLSKIPNARNLMPIFKSQIVKRGGNTYMIPVVWGYDTILFNKKYIPEDDTLTQSWGLIFNDKYAGKVALRDEPYQMLTVAAFHLGHKDPNNMDERDINEVTRFLIRKKKNFRTLWSSFGQAVALMASGEVWMMYGWIAMRAALQRQGHDVTNNWPREGVLIWNQSAFIPKDSRKSDASHAVINAMLSKEYGRKLTEITQYPSTSIDTAQSYSKADQRRYGYDIADRDLNLYAMSQPANIDKWVEAWGRFKLA